MLFFMSGLEVDLKVEKKKVKKRTSKQKESWEPDEIMQFQELGP